MSPKVPETEGIPYIAEPAFCMHAPSSVNDDDGNPLDVMVGRTMYGRPQRYRDGVSYPTPKRPFGLFSFPSCNNGVDFMDTSYVDSDPITFFSLYGNVQGEDCVPLLLPLQGIRWRKRKINVLRGRSRSYDQNDMLDFVASSWSQKRRKIV